MPGIVGCITHQPQEHAKREVRRMLDAMCHEDFYVSGVWAEESMGAYAGWVARSGSFAEEMPLGNERGDVAMIFSGEEFPEPGRAATLIGNGHKLEQAGPSYLVHFYEDDSQFPRGLNGRFHGLVTDRNRGTALLFNDRFGMHRIYYHQSADTFYFAAEAKAILAVRPELRTPDSRSMGEFVSSGAVLENRTLFEGIHVLPPGSAWTFSNGALERKSAYFNAKEWEEQEGLDAESYFQELRAVFTRNLPRYFAGNDSIGMSLTGGLDTRMVMACQRSAPGTLPCYTFGSMLRENQDVRVARKVADVCGQPFQVLTAGTQFLSLFGHYAERAVYLTDGCVDVSRAPDLYLNEQARQIAPVRMTGLFGGEILRGIRAFKPVAPTAGSFCPEFLSQIHGAAQTYAGIARCHPVTFAAFRQNPWYLYGSLALEQTQLAMRSPFLDNEFVRTVYRAPASSYSGNEVSLRLVGDGNPALLEIPTDRGVSGNGGGIHGKASRGLLEFLFKAEYAYDMGMPQWLARIDNTLRPLRLERLFLGRHKPFHFRTWYRNALASYIQEMLLDERALSRSYVDRKGLEAVVRGHVSGQRNYTSEIHKLLTLEILHRVFLDGAG